MALIKGKRKIGSREKEVSCIISKKMNFINIYIFLRTSIIIFIFIYI